MAVLMLVVLFPSHAAASVASGWQGATSIDDDAGGVFDMAVGADADGNVLAVWYQFGSLYYNRYSQGSGWGVSGLVELNDTAFTRYSALAVSRTGDAAAIWVYPGSGADFVYANRYSAAAGWGSAVEIHPGGTGYASDTAVAINGAGTGFAAWRETGAGLVGDIWAARFTLVGGWESPEKVDASAGEAYNPDLAVDESGNAIMVWDQVNGSFAEVEVATYVNGVGWSSPQTLDHNDTADEVTAEVAISAAGDALVVWAEAGAVPWHIKASSYTESGGWQPPVAVEQGTTGRPTLPRVAMDAYNNGCAVWLEYPDSGSRDAWQNCYQKGVGWGQEALLEMDDAHDVGLSSAPVDIAMDAVGNAIATWAQSDGIQVSAWGASRWSSGSWGTPVLLDTDNTGGTTAPAAAMSANGNGMAVWGQDYATRTRVMANRYVAPDRAAPYLFLTAPSWGYETNLSSLYVQGYTEVGARVVVQGLEAAVGYDGAFSVLVPLMSGFNWIMVVATDPSGNPTFDSVPVTYNDPAPLLAAGLAAAEARLNASQAQVAAVAAELDAATQNLTETQADLNATQGGLLAAEAALVDAQAGLASAQASLVRLDSELASARSNASAEHSRVTALEASSAASNATAAQADASAKASRDQAGGASTLALLGVLLGVAGLGVGALSLARGRGGAGGQADRGWEPKPKQETVGEASPRKPE